MQVRLLESAARITIAIAILGFAVVGEPGPEQRAAMDVEGDSYRSDPSLATSTPLPTEVPPEMVLPTPVLTGPPTRIQAPSIALDAPVVEVGWRIRFLGDEETLEWEVPDDAAGYHKGSAYPGQVGNTVISGHNNMGSEVFRYLADLNIGDELILWVGAQEFHYRIAHKEILLEDGVSDEQRRENARWIAPTDDERVTLVTCWPYTGNSHRLIVVARPTS